MNPEKLPPEILAEILDFNFAVDETCARLENISRAQFVDFLQAFENVCRDSGTPLLEELAAVDDLEESGILTLGDLKVAYRFEDDNSGEVNILSNAGSFSEPDKLWPLDPATGRRTKKVLPSSKELVEKTLFALADNPMHHNSGHLLSKT